MCLFVEDSVGCNDIIKMNKGRVPYLEFLTFMAESFLKRALDIYKFYAYMHAK